MKLDLKNLPEKLQPVLRFLRHYTIFIFIVIMLGIFGFLVLRINQFSNTEPTDDALTEKLQTVQRPKIDQTVLDKIEQLRTQNIQVQALFEQARNNPFSE